MKVPCKPQKLGPLEDLTGTSLGCQVQAGYTANPVQHEKFFPIECIWEIVETSTLKLTFI